MAAFIALRKRAVQWKKIFQKNEKSRLAQRARGKREKNWGKTMRELCPTHGKNKETLV
jgi:hypothetical protein